ncbi:cytochrome b5 isoform X4 [Medicago truncatula]|uniref:cytochrome b5 isoform X4 n=1 Tax=Medicago truncatula TaxID=3880 RepID=UPI000D2F3BDB|nr:cytochrome b5 isoform X4 [Medicago truncatula]
MGSKSETLTFEDVAKHNHKNDCWIIVNKKVYDVTPFLDDHPGGDEALLSATGKDATTDFEDVGHSDSATEMMEKYYVGEFDANTLPVEARNNPTAPIQASTINSNQSSGVLLKFLQYLVPLLILGVAFALQYYGKRSKSNESERGCVTERQRWKEDK